MAIIDTIKTLAGVERVSEWRDRTYITLTINPKFNADRLSKLWLKGNVLTVETGKGYHSDAYIAAKHAVIDAVKAAGGSVRES